MREPRTIFKEYAETTPPPTHTTGSSRVAHSHAGWTRLSLTVHPPAWQPTLVIGVLTLRSGPRVSPRRDPVRTSTALVINDIGLFRGPKREGTMAAIIDVEELGRRIRKLRLDRRMTLKQVENSCGLSATHLSEIERGRTSPTIGALVRIARALERDASFFIESEEREEVASHLRELHGQTPPRDGVTAEKLSAGIPGSGMFPYRIKLEADGRAELRFSAEDLPGDVIYLLQSGSVSASIGESEVQLSAGDSMQASLSQAHHLRATGEQPAEFLVFSTRPIPEAR